MDPAPDMARCSLGKFNNHNRQSPVCLNTYPSTETYSKTNEAAAQVYAGNSGQCTDLAQQLRVQIAVREVFGVERGLGRVRHLRADLQSYSTYIMLKKHDPDIHNENEKTIVA